MNRGTSSWCQKIVELLLKGYRGVKVPRAGQQNEVVYIPRAGRIRGKNGGSQGQQEAHGGTPSARAIIVCGDAAVLKLLHVGERGIDQKKLPELDAVKNDSSH